MADFVGDFLEESASRLSDSERAFAVLKDNPEEKEAWATVCAFFGFVRSVAPFAGFSRSYHLSDAAVIEIEKNEEKRENASLLPALQEKFLRIQDILTSAKEAKKESDGSDADLLASVPGIEPANDAKELPAETVFPAETEKRVADLDKRESELSSWKQALNERENALKDQEASFLKERQTHVETQENLKGKLDHALSRLTEQEKIQNELEESLAETKLALQNCQEKISGQEELQKKAESLLAVKDNALNEMNRKVQDLTRLLEEKKLLNERREEELYQEIQQNKEQNEKLRNALDMMKESRSELSESHDKFFTKYTRLEKEYQNTQFRLSEEKRAAEQFYREKRELEKQHVEFNARMVALQENLNRERENVKNAEILLERQKKQDDILQSELRVSGWPYNPEKIQRELASLEWQRLCG